MPINCFRSPRSTNTTAPTPAARPVLTPTRSRISTLGRSRTFSSIPTPSRTSSNSSIAALPCRDRSSDCKIEALMMPLPPDDRGPPRCLRVSYPRIYGDIVGDMRRVKGCRDWRNFAVFEDESTGVEAGERSAEDAGRKRRGDWEKRMRKFSTDDYDGVLDTIG